MTLVCTGTIGIDTIQTPGGVERAEVLGGSCTYFAAAASFFGPVRIVAAVGDDFPDQHRGTIAKFPAIDAAGLEARAGSKTFRWGGRYHDNMDHRDTLFTELGVLAEAPPRVPEAFRDSAVAFLANSHPGVQAGMLEQLPRRRLTVADTMDLWINVARPELEHLLGQIDGLVLNYDEAELFTGLRNTVAAGRKLLEVGPRFVVVKKGEHGAILVHRDGLAALPAYPAERVIDPTGAGDSFAGGLMGSIARELEREPNTDPGAFATLRKAMAHGTVIASFTIEEFSLGRLASLTPRELEARFNDYRAMMHLV